MVSTVRRRPGSGQDTPASGTRTLREAGAGAAEARAGEAAEERGGRSRLARVRPGLARPSPLRPEGVRGGPGLSSCHEIGSLWPGEASGRPCGQTSPSCFFGACWGRRPRCRTRSNRCIGHSGRGPGKGLLVSCGCCDPLERTHGDRLKFEEMRVIWRALASPVCIRPLLPIDCSPCDLAL